ncbi:potassium-transporting ATPase subunit C [Crenobacter sp. SG2305]|uniref:potassium-transporting ATPase subunit C n=1 Tax=Crenobacter oryzisoli TaxID=3056844 RepID=UPI0025AA9C47|nr:potassium-transporting ATPase subunit C [Crenobacter sp. SG2305]MDN0083215.1 potassium-transporting ATPase subunit C [Crenobacter sp. SG2305]
MGQKAVGIRTEMVTGDNPIAAARGLPLERAQALIAAHTVGRTFGVFGEPRINVLSLNMALQSWQAATPQQTR